MAFRQVEDIRAWRAAYRFKLALYALIRVAPIAQDFALRDQIRAAAASAVSQIEEGFARFYPKDFARLVVGAKASIAESRGHLRDAVDLGHISEQTRQEHDKLAAEALREIAGLLDYLQSPEAEENARRIRAKRAGRRAERLANKERGTELPEPRTPNRNLEPEPRTGTENTNLEPGTRNPEPRSH